MPIGTKNNVIAGGGTHHIAIQARDWEESMKLYRDVLGMPVAVEFVSGAGQKIALLDAGDGSHIELFEPKKGTPKPGDNAANDPVFHFALATTDARAAIEHVRAAGYEVTIEPKSLNLGHWHVTIAFFKGPSGEVVEFFQTH
ncbi:MAG: VOC family protein [Planctomycetota bacterium]|nr:VOC family protein [Planctomycetota bacterium]MDA1141376.1 VOC family protein [Planctomycetota bacterium]